MFHIPLHLWAPFATINFNDNAALWLQSYEAQHCVDSWHELCIVVEHKFGKDLYQNYMRDLLSIRQTSDVLEYSNRFEQAKHKVLLHNKNLDEVFLVQKFLDGLKYNISSAITPHKPRTVDAALSLALMQEDLLETSAKRYLNRSSSYSSRPTNHTKNSGVLEAPPNDQKLGDKIEAKPQWENKLSTLREQCRAQGLCMRCGEKWGGGHKCPKQIPLHIMEEVWDIMNIEEGTGKEVDTSSTSSDEEILTLSVATLEGYNPKEHSDYKAKSTIRTF